MQNTGDPQLIWNINKNISDSMRKDIWKYREEIMHQQIQRQIISVKRIHVFEKALYCY